MNIAVIGGGNMGGALAKGLFKARGTDWTITVTSRTERTLDRLGAECPGLKTTTDNRLAANGSDVVILCVKPWLIDEVCSEVAPETGKATVISVAAGARNDLIDIYAMPNIAVEYGAGMTFVEENDNADAVGTALELFAQVGMAKLASPKEMAAGLMMSGCGIAYVMRFVRAMAEGGVELGFTPDVATEVALQTLTGAAVLLRGTGLHPERAIDRVTTPGGYTIRGLNELEHAGFVSAVIRALTLNKQ
ncbi:MAG: pyrroline-5-carboxylate reductase [Prevotella sp.]|nr:pyrroline-5-carboxylate reductase [Prevotella sp.]